MVRKKHYVDTGHYFNTLLFFNVDHSQYASLCWVTATLCMRSKVSVWISIKYNLYWGLDLMIVNCECVECRSESSCLCPTTYPPTQSCVVSVFVWWSLADMPFFFSSRHGASVLLHAEMVPNSESVFISVHSPSHHALWLPAFGLPCSVLLCPQSVSLSLMVSLFPSPHSLLWHSSDLFLPCWPRSNTGREERSRRGQECQILSSADTLGLFQQIFFFAWCCSSVEHFVCL